MSYRRMQPATVRPLAQYSRSFTRQRSVARMTPANWAIAAVGAILGVKDYANTISEYYGAVVVRAVAGNGRYVKVARIISDSEVSERTSWHFAATYVALADTFKEYGLLRRIKQLELDAEDIERRATQAARADVNSLSRATVTRALVHAYDNDYCAETAVALISAGHKMPDVTLDVEVTVRGRITLEGKRNYYPLRRLFGKTRGDVDDASGLELDSIHDRIMEELGEFDIESVRHLGTEVEWHAPTIRPASDPEYSESSEIMNGQENVSSYR